MPPPIPRGWWDGIDWFRVLGMLTVGLVILYVAVKLLVWTVKAVLDLAGWLRAKVRRWRQRMEEAIPLIPFEAERVVSSSPLVSTKVMPSFQVEIWISEGGEFVKAGNGFRCSENQVMTAYHVVMHAKEVRVQTSSGKVEMEASRFSQLNGDVAVVLLSSAELSALRVTKPRLAACATVKGTGTFGQVVAYGQQSMGMVMPYDAFGYVTYTGSTVPGFSGSPYYLGNCVLGMHIGTQGQNLGYDGSYLAMLIRSTQESTQWLETQILRAARRGQKIRATRSPFDPDEVQLVVNGQYHVVQYDNIPDRLDVMLKWDGSEDIVGLKETAYVDSGNGSGPSSNAVSEPAAARGPGKMLESGDSAPSPSTLKRSATRQSTYQPHRLVMELPGSTHVQPNVPLPSIESAAVQPSVKQTLRPKKRSSKLSLQRRNAFLLGITDSCLMSQISSIVAWKGWTWTVSQDIASLQSLAQQMAKLSNGTE